MHTSNTENREQTFDEKLDEILLRLIVSNGKDGLMGTPDSSFLEAKQAIKTLVLEDVVGSDLRVGDEIAENRSYTGERLLNKMKAEQRQIINPQKEVKDE